MTKTMKETIPKDPTTGNTPQTRRTPARRAAWPSSSWPRAAPQEQHVRAM
eukprot:CAMPEP_0181224710 /NCGR_PEP_ID=MMETSP1096-20121128/31278_1 /TAXON_ID=156174 ORGANISM="Chrysochromulina ericina, Strain CCMP281" /NCGR_SAMPLE_ID=MMETSP1096 /ASSEMBLY_ACC=CAM_ASM_000453 /LENGTH=49 /DNA_ID=CAMNT_0023317823 /DNA_START=842 /DNA_END=991 /DNA_ORIENTATION=+